MLEFMRRRARSTWIKVIFLMIVVVFIFWGVGGSIGGGRVDVVANVDGRAISTREFQRAYENVKAAYRDAYKDQLTPEVMQSLNLKQRTIEQLIDSSILAAEARHLGFTVSDEEVRQSIAALPAFQEYGSFSQEQYLRVLRYLRLTPNEFEDEQRTQLLIQKLQRLITDAPRVTDGEVRDLFRLSREQVTLSFVKIESADLLAGIAADPAGAEEFYNTHRESFRQPDRVKFAYIAYPAASFESAVQEVTPQAVTDFYTEQKDGRFTVKARAHARHILFSRSSTASTEEKTQVRTTATGVLTRARAGEDFPTLAKTYSQDTATAANGGDLGFFERGRMVPAFEEAVFNLTAGGISDLVETPFGLHIIKVEATEPERVRPLTEVEAEIRQELTRARARDRARERARADQRTIQNGAALAEVAQAANLAVVETPLVSRDETLPNLGRQPALIEAALALTPQQVSEPLEVADAWYLVLPREKVPSTVPDFATVAEEAEKRRRSEKAEQLAKEKAEAVLARLQETKNLATAAAEQRLTVEESDPFTRQGSYIPKMGNLADLKKAAFRLTSDAPIAPQVSLWGGNAFVAVLKEQTPPDPQEFEKQKDTIREQLLKSKQNAAVEELVRHLKKQATITYNPDVLLKTPA